MEKIKLYRHTIKHMEYIKDGNPIITYDQTGWSSISTYIPGKDRDVVKTEEKEIEVNELCTRKCV